MSQAVIVSTARTPLAKSWKGAFNMTHGATLGGHAVAAAQGESLGIRRGFFAVMDIKAAPGLAAGVATVSAGTLHTCAVMGSGAVRCWGFNGYGQLGDGTTLGSPVPVDVTGLATGIMAVAAGGYHACALTAAGGVKCWGRNDKGQTNVPPLHLY